MMIFFIRMMQERLSHDEVAQLTADYSHMKIGIWVSFAEVYNEYIYDLLQPEPPKAHIRAKLPLGLDSQGKTYVKNLSSVSVSTGLEAYEILQYGMHNLNYASTNINAHSSRSHCIFTVKLVQANSLSDEVQISHFHFCDLAGSERVKVSNSAGDRLKESSNINNSLHVLGRCIKAIRESQKHKEPRLIPFRESKLTRLFQPALTGQETIVMIVNISPDKDMFDESQHVLNLSAIAKDVTIENTHKPVKINLKPRMQQGMDKKKLLPLVSEESLPDPELLQEQVIFNFIILFITIVLSLQ